MERSQPIASRSDGATVDDVYRSYGVADRSRKERGSWEGRGAGGICQVVVELRSFSFVLRARLKMWRERPEL